MNKVLLLCAASALFVVGCGSGSGTSADASPAPDKTAPADTTGKTADATPPATPPASGAALIGYAAVQDVFSKSCIGCHGAGRAKGGIHLTDHDSVLKGGKDGPIVVAGDPASSVLIKALKRLPGARPMPPAGPLGADQVKVIEDWVKDGAKA